MPVAPEAFLPYFLTALECNLAPVNVEIALSVKVSSGHLCHTTFNCTTKTALPYFSLPYIRVLCSPDYQALAVSRRQKLSAPAWDTILQLYQVRVLQHTFAP